MAGKRDYDQARSAYQALISQNLSRRWLALIENDLGALDGLVGNLACARVQFERALAIDPDCDAARHNLTVLDGSAAEAGGDGSDGVGCVRAEEQCAGPSQAALAKGGRIKVAIVSLLFNWPSTGGGTVHTAEAGEFLHRAGYDVRHFYAQYEGWRVGRVTLPLAVPSEPLQFDSSSWNAPEIQRRFREAIDQFAPDYVIITDSWNFKPLFAEAVRGYRYFLRLAALECLCPLNNVRLLIDAAGNAVACPRHQLASPHLCSDCVTRRQQHTGSLHQAERELSGYGTAAYDAKLRQAFAEAEGVLVVNPLIAAMVGPFSNAVHVVPSGFNAARFPWPWPSLVVPPFGGTSPRTTEAHPAPAEAGTPTVNPICVRSPDRTTLFFAGLVEEFMKGFSVLQAACRELWARRQDFDLVVTADPPTRDSGYSGDVFTRFIGWRSQADLPWQMRQADILVFPTVAEEALGRSAVEAMGVGRPVVASRIGGLPFTVADGATGLLFEPGNVGDLAAKIEILLDDPALRDRMGHAGRRRFEEHFTWEAIIEKHYRRLLSPVQLKSVQSPR